MAKPEDVAEEYRVALRQLRAATERRDRVLEQADADLRLAAKRYEAARQSWVRLALDGEDEFLPSVLESEEQI